MFVGREKELTHLNGLYNTNGFQFVVMYGRRRVGKTTLIAEFLKEKEAVFFAAQEYDDETALRLFSEKVYGFFEINDLPPFDTWNRAFEFIAQRAQKKRFILVLDEFPYLAAANKSIPSILQNTIDHHLKNSRLFLIVCGSSISFMERGILSEKSPLYGRLSSQMEIEPFGYLESAKFFPNYKNEEKAAAYGIMGGIPQYLSHVNASRRLRDNIIAAVLSKSSVLYEEPRNLLKEELRKPMVYNSIIEAIAKGQTGLNDISTKTGIPRDKCLKYIRSLLELRILKRETPAGESAGRRSLYKLKDNFFKFWYAFIFENSELVEQGNGDLLYDNIILPALPDYLGYHVFEEICRDYLRSINGNKKNAPRLPFLFTGIGRWWGSDPRTRKEVEIDILAYNKSQALFCECKWTKRQTGTDILTALEDKAAVLTKYNIKYYALFSKSGFTADLKQKTQNRKDVLLIDLDKIFL